MKGIFSNPFAEVRQEPVEVGGDAVSKVGIRVQNDDGEWELAGILHKDWHLIKNSIARDVGDDIRSRSGREWRELKLIWDGRKYAHYFITIDPITQINTHQENNGEHQIHLGMMMRNAYDGSSKFGLEMFACDYHCMNQFISRNRFGYFAIYHSDKETFLIDDAVENISVGAEKLIAIAPRLQEMTEATATTKDIQAAYRSTTIPKSKWGSVIEHIEQATLFGLYTAMTYVASHEMRGFNSISVGNSVSDHFLDNI